MIFGMDNFHLFTASSEMKCADGWMDGWRPKKGRKGHLVTSRRKMRTAAPENGMGMGVERSERGLKCHQNAPKLSKNPPKVPHDWQTAGGNHLGWNVIHNSYCCYSNT